MISAVPCIATLLELSPSPPSEHSDGLLILKSDGSGLETSADVQLTGRLLMQNELSVAYWGKMTSRGDAGARVTSRRRGGGGKPSTDQQVVLRRC